MQKTCLKNKLFIGFLFILLQCTGGSRIFSNIDDRAITSSIIVNLIKDLNINHLKIKVYTDEGEVFLIGRVERFEQRILAENHARNTKHVWSVINHLKVGKAFAYETSKHDDKIKKHVLSKISDAKLIPFLNLNIESLERDLFLIGRVPTNKIREEIILISENTPEVNSIFNYLKANKKN